MITVKNWLNYDYRQQLGEVNEKPSQTVPDQTMGLKEILHRFAHGLPIPNDKSPIYQTYDGGPEDVLPNVRAMDLADLQTLRESMADEIARLEQQSKSELQAHRKRVKEAQTKQENMWKRLMSQLSDTNKTTNPSSQSLPDGEA